MIKKDFDVAGVLRKISHDFHGPKKDTFKNVLLVGMQHILGTTVDMLVVMKEYGLTHAVIGGKAYSTHSQSAERIKDLDFTYVASPSGLEQGHFDIHVQKQVQKIWLAALEKIKKKKFDLIIILDDGSDLLRATPKLFFNEPNGLTMLNKPGRIIGIEQTKSGINHPLFKRLPFPIIDVAGSFAKTKIEYPEVAALIIHQIEALIQKTMTTSFKPTVGIIGYGTMGKAMARRFTAKGFSVMVHDRNHSKHDSFNQIRKYNKSSTLMKNADIIVGCTGEDITLDKANLSTLLHCEEKKWLISTSSKDNEFNCLLKFIQKDERHLSSDPLQTFEYKNPKGGSLEMVKGGFPINFTNEVHSVPPQHIWPTRAALMLACFSACEMSLEKSDHFAPKSFMLSPEAQWLILHEYARNNTNLKELGHLCRLGKQELNDFIIRHSDSIPLPLTPETIAKTVVMG